MTYHSANGRLMCHYCGHSEPAADTCPECGGECDAAELIALYDDIRAGHVSDAEVVGLWIEKLDARRVA